MHVLEGVKILYSLADISEVSLYFGFGELPVPKFDLVVQTATLSELQHHIRHVLIFLVVVVYKLDDIWVVQLVMHVDFLLRIAAVNLHCLLLTILIATISPV